MTEIFKFSDFFISSLLILQQITNIKLEHCPVNIFFHGEGESFVCTEGKNWKQLGADSANPYDVASSV